MSIFYIDYTWVKSVRALRTFINIEREGVQKNKRHKYFEVSRISKLL
jgi:hypothetical protein